MKLQSFYSVGLIEQMLFVGKASGQSGGSSTGTVVGVVAVIVIIAAIIVVVLKLFIFKRPQRRLAKTRKLNISS